MRLEETVVSCRDASSLFAIGGGMARLNVLLGIRSARMSFGGDTLSSRVAWLTVRGM
jgi:hypothetical protein